MPDVNLQDPPEAEIVNGSSEDVTPEAVEADVVPEVTVEIARRPLAPGGNIAPLDAEGAERLMGLAKMFAESGMFKDIKQAGQAFAKMLIGHELGLSPGRSMMDIHIVEGKPELSANLQATLVKVADGYDYREVTNTDECVALEFFRNGESLGISKFDEGDAQKANLAGKGNHKSYPRNMKFARAMTNGIGWYCPEVTGGMRLHGEGDIHAAPSAKADAPWATMLESTGDKRELIDRVMALTGAKGVDVAATFANMGEAWGGVPRAVLDTVRNLATLREMAGMEDAAVVEPAPGSVAVDLREAISPQEAAALLTKAGCMCERAGMEPFDPACPVIGHGAAS